MTNIITQDDGNLHAMAAGRMAGLASATAAFARPARLVRLVDNWLKRGAVVRLGQLDDRLLRDIGMDRSDILWAMNLPIAEDAETQLMIRARGPGRQLW